MNYLISSIIGYLLGSIPTAYLLLKKTRGIDVTASGSGNVGAFNSFKITKSKLTGLIVLLIDFTKGALSVLLSIWLYPGDFTYPALAILFAVFSHCFNPWIEFKGGRGLATAAGGAVVIFPYLLLVWCVLWVIFYLMKREILVANISATIFSLVLVYNSADIAMDYAYPKPSEVSELIIVTSAVLIIIFIRHIEPFKKLITDFKTKRVRKK